MISPKKVVGVLEVGRGEDRLRALPHPSRISDGFPPVVLLNDERQ